MDTISELIQRFDDDKKPGNFQIDNEVISTAFPSPIPPSAVDSHINTELRKLKDQLFEINLKLKFNSDLLFVKINENERMKEMINFHHFITEGKEVENSANCCSKKCVIW